MADKQTQDDAARTRIINHMNADHHDSIIRYLQHYHSLPTWTASAGHLTSISLDSTIITAGGKPYHIPFNPPLTSLRETRARVVEMDRECVAALGRDDITIKDFVPPTGLYSISFLVCLATFIGYSQRWWFAPGSLVEQILGAGFAKFSWTIQPWLISGMFLIHGTELALFIPGLLQKHSVNPRTTAWWLWAAAFFVEGVFGRMRFLALVERKREEKMRQKH